MTPSNPRRRRWSRFTIRRIMIAVPIIALAIILVAGIDPFRRDPLQDALAQSVLECANSMHTFHATAQVDWSAKPDPTWIADKPELINGKCVLKMHHATQVISKDGKIHGTTGSQLALAEDGRLESNHWHSMGTGGGSSIESASKMAAIKTILATLPPSQPDIPPGPSKSGIYLPPERGLRTENRAFAIGFWHQGVWVTRTYDDNNQPPAIAKLMHELFGDAGYFEHKSN